MIRIDVLPDNVLLDIFYLYSMAMNSSLFYKKGVEAWQSLVHVCQRWRNLVFGSPRRLDLQLYCTVGTPAKDRLDIWPALPLIIQGLPSLSSTMDNIRPALRLTGFIGQGFPSPSLSMDNIIAALGQSNRVRHVVLYLAGWQWEGILAQMQVPFPELADLRLWLIDGIDETPAIPDSFLGRSAPRLRALYLNRISFPGLPKLLLSATHLVELDLYGTPHSAYISPKAMVALLSVISSLETFGLGFRSPQSRPHLESPSPPHPKRSILPILRTLYFRGVIEYLEELVTRIDAPQLGKMEIVFFNQIDFDCPRLTQFINYTPTLRGLDEARVQFDNHTASVTLRSQTSKFRFDCLRLCISCRERGWQLSSIEQVCNSLPHLSTVEDLYVERRYPVLVRKGDSIENALWLEILLRFTMVKNLFLSEGSVLDITDALQELVRGRIIEVLPSLQNIFVDGRELFASFQENIGQFVAARQLSNHPVTISAWEKLTQS